MWYCIVCIFGLATWQHGEQDGKENEEKEKKKKQRKELSLLLLSFVPSSFSLCVECLSVCSVNYAFAPTSRRIVSEAPSSD